MKKLAQISLLIGLSLLLLLRCSKDTVPADTVKNPVIKKENERLGKVVPTAKITLNLEGIITNEDGVPLSGVLVKAGDKEKTTDAEGYFQFIEVSLNQNYAVVKANKSGYFEGLRTFTPTPGAFNKITIALLSKGAAKNINAETGGMLEFESGKIKLDFSANALIDDKGNLYKGNVEIRARYIDPEADNFGEVMPGTLAGLTESGTLSGMVSYGMISVEMTDEAGKKIEISNNQEVEVEMPAILDAPTEMPIWHFNETFGLWVEAGKATKIGDKYVFNANYFSAWNLDVPFNGVDVTIQFENQEGIPLASQKICIYDNGYNLLQCAYTDNEGKLELVIAPQDMIFKIFAECGDILTKSFTINGPTGKVVISNSDLTLGRVYKLTGKMEDCEEILSDKFFTLSGENNILFQGKTKVDGTFEADALLCEIPQNTDHNLSLRVYVSGSTYKQYNIGVIFNGSEQNINIDFCEEEETNPYLNPNLTYGKLTDLRDGQEYATIQIGTQVWMAQNLNYTTGKSECYDDNYSNCAKYGRLYDWNTALTACPPGWHLPSDSEWTVLITYLGEGNGGKMKSTMGWDPPYTGAPNSSGFSGLPGGWWIGDGSFETAGGWGHFWSSTEYSTDDAWAWIYILTGGDSALRDATDKVLMGLSCRCLKD